MKNFFINNSVEALILLREGHESLLKLHIHLEGEGGGEGVPVCSFQTDI